MPNERLLTKLREIRKSIRRTLDTADAKAIADRCDKYAFQSGYFGAHLGIVAEQLEWIEREIEVEVECKS